MIKFSEKGVYMMSTNFISSTKTGALKVLSPMVLLTLVLMLIASLFAPATGASAAGLTSTPASGYIGTVFTISASGFQVGEKINLTTTDPSATSLGAGYMYADTNGKFVVKVYTTDPSGLAATSGTNYTSLITDYDNSGNVVDQYLQLILFKPAVGAWTLNAQGDTSSSTAAYGFTITSSASATPAKITTTPASGGLGTVFTMKAGGFVPGEKVTLWTTNPSSKALDAGYLFADQSGNIILKVNSSDPNGLATAAGSNYETFITDFDSSGNVVDQYLQIILLNPTSGNWYLTSKGATSSVTQLFNFTISQ